MHFLNAKFFSILAAAAAVKGAPIEENTIEARAVVPHDSINPWPENVPNNALGNTLKRFEPFIHVAHGCQPYSAVDGNGNTRYENYFSFPFNIALLTHPAVVDSKILAMSQPAAVIRARAKPMSEVAGLEVAMESCTPGVSIPFIPSHSSYTF